MMKYALMGAYMKRYIDISPEVRRALRAKAPVVALESSILGCGMTYPQSIETIMRVEDTIRACGAVPAMTAIMNGKLKVGLRAEETDKLCRMGDDIALASRSDMPIIIAKKENGITTTSAAVIIAAMAGIYVLSTDGIGGVDDIADMSSDLEELSKAHVMAICGGAKCSQNTGKTLNYLESKGVPIIGYCTDDFPALCMRSSGHALSHRLDTPEQLAKAFYIKASMGLIGGMLVANPVPEGFAVSESVLNEAKSKAIEEASSLKLRGKEACAFIMRKMCEITSGESLESSVQLWLNNSRLAARTAASLCHMMK